MKVLMVIVLVIGSLMMGENARGQLFSTRKNLRQEQIMITPMAVPDRTSMTVVDTWVFLEADGAAVVLVYYDDALTKWQIDCVELYDLEGELLVVGWIDRFGVYQVAMDRGLLDPDNPRVVGVLVAVDVGTLL